MTAGQKISDNCCMPRQSPPLKKPKHILDSLVENTTKPNYEEGKCLMTSENSLRLLSYIKLTRELETSNKELLQINDALVMVLKAEERKSEAMTDKLKEMTRYMSALERDKERADGDKEIQRNELHDLRLINSELMSEIVTLKKEKSDVEIAMHILKRKQESHDDATGAKARKRNEESSISSGFEEQTIATDRSLPNYECSDLDRGIYTISTPKRPFPSLNLYKATGRTSCQGTEKFLKKHSTKIIEKMTGMAPLATGEETPRSLLGSGRFSRGPIRRMNKKLNKPEVQKYASPVREPRSCSAPGRSQRPFEDDPLQTSNTYVKVASIDNLETIIPERSESSLTELNCDYDVLDVAVRESPKSCDIIYRNPVLDRMHQFCLKRIYSSDICDVCRKSIKFTQHVKKCEACRQLVHTECAVKLQLPCAPRAATIPKQKLMSAALPLDFVHPDIYPQIPHIVIVIINHLNQFHLTTEGLYRIQAVKSEVDLLYNEFMTNRRVPNLKKFSAAALTGVLKRFLGKAIKGQLINRGALGDLITGDLDDHVHIVNFLLMLPLPNRDTLSLLALHWKKVAELHYENGMTVDNLARCLAPTIFFSSGIYPVDMKEQIHALRSIIELPEEFHMQHMSYDGPNRAQFTTPRRKGTESLAWRADAVVRYTPAPVPNTIRRKQFNPNTTRL